MHSRSLLLVASVGFSVQLVAACGGQARESASAHAGSSGTEEVAGSGNASGAGATGGAPEAGAAGAIASAGAGGATPSEPLNHRPTATTCDHTRATKELNVPTDPGFDPYIKCRAHADCTEGENGRCTATGQGWVCTYDSCFADSDCSGDMGDPKVCACEGGSRSDNNVCVRGNCQVDADCGDGGYCSPSFGDCGAFLGVTDYYCHTTTDECVNDADCNLDGSRPDAFCAFMPTVGHWQCGTTNCAG